MVDKFRRCSEIVVAHDGIVDNFRGDAVLAFFNLPIRREDHVMQAISAAKQIQLAVPEINASWGATTSSEWELELPPEWDSPRMWGRTAALTTR